MSFALSLSDRRLVSRNGRTPCSYVSIPLVLVQSVPHMQRSGAAAQVRGQDRAIVARDEVTVLVFFIDHRLRRERQSRRRRQ